MGDAAIGTSAAHLAEIEAELCARARTMGEACAWLHSWTDAYAGGLGDGVCRIWAPAVDGIAAAGTGVAGGRVCIAACI